MPTTKQQLTNALITFYHKPVAKVSLELLLSLSTVIFFAVFAIRPTLLTMSDLIKQIEDKQKLAQDLDKKIAALSSVQSEYLRLQPQLSLLDEAVPSSPQLLYTIKVIERLASEHGLVITNVNVPEVPPESGPATPTLARTQTDQAVGTGETKINTQPRRVDLRISIKTKGNYQDIRQFVEALQQYRRTLVVENVIFTIQEQQGTRALESVVNIVLPYFDSGASKESSSTPTPKKP